MNNQNVVNYLHNKYGMEFQVLGYEFYQSVNRYNYKACPSNNPKLVFTVEHAKDSDSFTDLYIEALYRVEASSYLNKELEMMNIPFPYVCTARQSCKASIVDYKNIPSWESLFVKNPENFQVIVKINFFSKPTDEVLNIIKELDEKWRALKLSKSGFAINFIDPSSIENRTDEEFNFGYDLTNDEYFESKNQEFIYGKILYYIHPRNSMSPSIDDLRSIIKKKFLVGRYSAL